VSSWITRPYSVDSVTSNCAAPKYPGGLAERLGDLVVVDVHAVHQVTRIIDGSGGTRTCGLVFATSATTTPI